MSPDLIRVLTELRIITNKFNLTGSGVAGDLVNGYTVDVVTRGGSAGSGSPIPPTSCPTTILLTYNNLIFDCGCHVLGTSRSIIATDVDLSGRSVTLQRRTETICAPLFGWGVDGINFCSYESSGWTGSAPLHAVTYLDTGCSVSPSNSDVYPRPNVLMLNDVWYVFDYFQTGDGDAAIFIGSTADPLLPITNTMSCSDPVDRSGNPIIDCHGPNLIAGIPVVPGVAHSGTVTLTF